MSPIIQLSVGYSHTCVVSDVGEVFCWGATDVPGTQRVHRLDVPPTLKVVSEVTRTCGLTQSGQLWCWIWNDEEREAIRWDVELPARGCDLVGGHRHACAHLCSGGVICFDKKMNEQVLTHNAKSVAAGYPGLACAIEHDGKIVCSERGPDAAPTRVDPHELLVVNERLCVVGEKTHCWRNAEMGWREVEEVDRELKADDDGAYCTLQDKRVVCWGENGVGQAGGQATDEQLAPPTDMGLSGIEELGMGADHVCVRSSAGKILCWGFAAHGRLGDIQWTSLPPSAPLRTDGLKWKAVAGDGAYNCALTEGGAAWCWGKPLSDLYGVEGIQATPTRVSHLDGANEILISGSWLCAQRGTHLSCFDDEGNVVFHMDGVAVAAAGRLLCATDDRGVVSCWEYDPETGASSLESLAFESVPDRLQIEDDLNQVCGVIPGVRVECAMLDDDQWRKYEAPISVRWLAPGAHIALTGDGDLARWSPSWNKKVTEVDREPLPIADPVQLIASPSHQCVLDGNGQVWCRDLTSDDMISAGMPGQQFEFQREFVKIPALSDVVEISGEWTSTCGIRESGDLFCFGSGHLGQLGDGRDWLVETPAEIHIPPDPPLFKPHVVRRVSVDAG